MAQCIVTCVVLQRLFAPLGANDRDVIRADSAKNVVRRLNSGVKFMKIHTSITAMEPTEGREHIVVDLKFVRIEHPCVGFGHTLKL